MAVFWALLLCLLMVLAVALEILTPSLGFFTLVAIVCAASSIVVGFQQSLDFGYCMLALNIVLLPGAFWYGLRMLRHSPLMHRRELVAGTQSAPDAPPLTPLLGRSGHALTPLRPAGTVMLGDQRVDVITDGRFVEPNTEVKVVRVEGNRVFVEPFKA